MNNIKLRKGDTVAVISGKDKKKVGKILKIDRIRQRVVVEGVNIIKKAQKPQREGEKGAIIEMESGIHWSNVAISCPKCGPVKIAMKIDGESKIRVCKKCGGAF